MLTHYQYMVRTMEGPSELWRMRKQFTLQVASNSFASFVLFLNSRLPGRFHLSRRTGLVAMSELLPGKTRHSINFVETHITDLTCSGATNLFCLWAWGFSAIQTH